MSNIEEQKVKSECLKMVKWPLVAWSFYWRMVLASIVVSFSVILLVFFIGLIVVPFFNKTFFVWFILVALIFYSVTMLVSPIHFALKYVLRTNLKVYNVFLVNKLGEIIPFKNISKKVWMFLVWGCLWRMFLLTLTAFLLANLVLILENKLITFFSISNTNVFLGQNLIVVTFITAMSIFLIFFSIIWFLKSTYKGCSFRIIESEEWKNKKGFSIFKSYIPIVLFIILLSLGNFFIMRKTQKLFEGYLASNLIMQQGYDGVTN